MADEKKYLRAILKRARGAMPAGLAAALSAEIQSLVLDADFYRRSRAVVLYSPIGNEVSTEAILNDALAAGRAVFYPRLDFPARALSLRRVRARSDLKPGALGIPQPQSTVETADPAELDGCLVMAPGVAFSTAGARIGRGGGHYDRLLAEMSAQAISVGLAYSFQLLDRIPESGWDRRLNFVVTESAVYPALDASGRGGGLRAQGGNPR